ncbi:MAG: acyl carrier protein [Candidatus Krumholzibacteria bacterium]|nr:acyl carrier protein [Candidatus Krumholzibacteria bacterium]
MESKKLIREFIITNFLFGSNDAKFSDDDSFLETSIIDSTGMLELVAFVETKFGIEVADTELVPENLDSINRLASFIERKRVASAS